MLGSRDARTGVLTVDAAASGASEAGIHILSGE